MAKLRAGGGPVYSKGVFEELLPHRKRVQTLRCSFVEVQRVFGSFRHLESIPCIEVENSLDFL